MGAVAWLVTDSVEDALDIRGVCSRLYQFAEAELGYYDPANVQSNNKVQAFWYTNNDLQIHVLFKEEAHALQFHIRLLTDFITIPITSRISQTSYPRNEQRIYSRDYDAQEPESPRGTTSSAPTEFLVIDPFSPVFKYQRIEVGTVFGPHGKAESAHLMPKADCHDNDDNNRLALSAEMHAAYDGMTFDFPVVNMEVVGVSKLPVLDNRYKVDLHVSVHSKRYAFLLERLKENSARTSDPLVMKTFVYVKDPVIFCKNMAWKHQNVKQLQQDYFNSAVM